MKGLATGAEGSRGPPCRLWPRELCPPGNSISHGNTHTHQPQVSTVICPLDRALSGAGGHPLALRIWMASLIMTVHNLELPPTFGKSDYKNSCKEKSQSSRVTWS